MKLNAWLKQNPAFSKRLQVVERLAQALNAVHDRGEPLAALDPEHVEVDGDCDCDISAARRGSPAPGYCAPERAEGGPPSPEADIYAAGAIAWEVLAGRPYAAAPSHLAEAARDVQRDLADAVMACLEQSPQWRPRDLTYIAQLAQHMLGTGSRDQGASRPASARATVRPASSRSVSTRSGRTASSRTARVASPIRTTPLHEPRSHAMLAVIAGVVVAVAGAGYWWMTRDKGAPATATPTTVAAAAPAALTVTARPEPRPESLATPPPVTVASAPPLTVAPAPVPTYVPTPVPTPVATATARPAPTPVPPPVTMARALPPPPVTQPVLTEIRRAPTPPPVVPAPTTTTTTVAAAPAPTLPRETPMLSTVSPPSVRRPGKYLLDLRGTGLRADLRVRVVPLKTAPHGITILRQVCKSPNLFQVLIEVDAQVTPGGYAITLADTSGGQTAPLTLTVGK